MSQDTITIKAAVAFAAQLRTKGDAEAARDPYASPYRPTEASARKLCFRQAQQALAELPDDATAEQREEASKAGPARAIAYMTMRSKQHAAQEAEHALLADRAFKRHARRQEQNRKHREAARAHLSPGKRIDDVIARLRLVAAPAASKLETDIGENAEKDMTPKFTVDAAGRAIAIASRAVREIEALEDEFKVRDLAQVAA